MTDRIYTAELIDHEETCTLGELCEACGVHAELVIELVDYGVIEPRGPRPEAWRFPPGALRRAQRALRLRRDLGLGLPGLSLALDLLDELDTLRHRVRTLEARLRALQGE